MTTDATRIASLYASTSLDGGGFSPFAGITIEPSEGNPVLCELFQRAAFAEHHRIGLGVHHGGEFRAAPGALQQLGDRHQSAPADYATNQVPPEYSVSLTLSQKFLAEDALTLGGRASYTGPRAIGHAT